MGARQRTHCISTQSSFSRPRCHARQVRLRRTRVRNYWRNSMRYLSIFLFMVSAGNCTLTAARERSFEWPRVQPVVESFYFRDASKAWVRLFIRDNAGKLLYRLECEPGFTSDVAVGNFECYMNSPSSVHEPDLSLLNEDPLDGAVAHSRGEIWAEHLEGNCANYPGWGTVREFRLRGMRVSLRLNRIELVRRPNPVRGGRPTEVPFIRRFGLNVEVAADPTALSAVAEPVPFVLHWVHPEEAFDASLNCSEPIDIHVPGQR